MANMRATLSKISNYKYIFSLFVFQLRQEFGYEVNASDPQFAEKIAAKEKEYAKRAKEEKKKDKVEKERVRKELEKGS